MKFLKKKSASSSPAVKPKAVVENAGVKEVKESTLLSNRNGSNETLVDLAKTENKSQNQFEDFKDEMLKLFEEREKKNTILVNSLLQKIDILTEENRQYQIKIKELEKKISELESNSEIINKVQGLEQKVENLEDQYQEQTQSTSQRELSEEQIAQAMDLFNQNNRDVMNLQKKIDQLEKSDAKILEGQSFMTREVERLNSIIISNEEIKVSIDIRGGAHFIITTTSAETVADFKKRIQQQLGFDVNAQIINFNGRALEDEYTLHDYNIINESTVQLALRN